MIHYLSKVPSEITLIVSLGMQPVTSICMQGNTVHVKGNRRMHKAVTGVISRFSTTVLLSVFAVNVWYQKER